MRKLLDCPCLARTNLWLCFFWHLLGYLPFFTHAKFLVQNRYPIPVNANATCLANQTACYALYNAIIPYSSILFTHSHSPRKFSFHSETRLSPCETASTFPDKLQLTRHSTASNLSSLQLHSAPGVDVEVQMRTVLSWEADAM